MKPMITRRWMLFVAALAVGQGVYLRLSNLRSEYKARAREYWGKAIKSRLDEINARKRIMVRRHPMTLEEAKKETAYNTAMQAKYERARYYPWLWVE